MKYLVKIINPTISLVAESNDNGDTFRGITFNTFVFVEADNKQQIVDMLFGDRATINAYYYVENEEWFSDELTIEEINNMLDIEEITQEQYEMLSIIFKNINTIEINIKL